MSLTFKDYLLLEAATPAQIEQELKDAQTEINRLKSKGMGELLPQYEDQYKRVVSRIRDLRQQQKTMKANSSTDEEKADNVKFKQNLANRKTDKSKVKQRAGEELSKGLKTANHWVKKLGGYPGIAKEIDRIVSKTNHGDEPIDVEALAKHFDLTPGSISRWLRRPEFAKVKARYPDR